MQRDFIVSYFPDPRTKALLLEGPKLDPLFWTDKDGRHSEPLYRECLHLWIVPADVRPDFLTLNPKVGPQPRCFYLSAAGKVYGLDSMGWISNPARLQEIESSEGLKEIGSEGGGELSWRGWRRDIRASIGEMR